MDEIWYKNPMVLFNSDRLFEVLPSNSMSLERKLNSVVRLAIYYALILLFFFNKSTNMLMLPLIVMVITFFLYNNEKMQMESTKNDIKNYLDENRNVNNLNDHDLDKIEEGFCTNQKTPIKIDGFGDICQLPTDNNPFANPLFTDIVDNPDRPPPCSIDDPEIAKDVDDKFNFNLYKDLSDVWDRNNSQRQFYSVPGGTIPNDRDSFMKWCCGVTNVAKDTNCGRGSYEFMHINP